MKFLRGRLFVLRAGTSCCLQRMVTHRTARSRCKCPLDGYIQRERKNRVSDVPYRAISPANHVPDETQPLPLPPQPWFT